MSDLPVLDARAAFVDVGSEQMHVSVAGGPPQVFGAVTAQLHALRDWLKAQGVRSVAMEATGVYWLPLYGVLEAAGFEVRMVNGRQTRNLPGRKTDMQDCQWGATLHSHGLLRAGFVPPAHIRRMQDYMRLRADHISMAATHVQHMQQALERMNVKLHDVIAKLTGVSGLAVVRAILGGERDPQRLLARCDTQIQRAKAERVKESLRGTWTEEHLFALSPTRAEAAQAATPKRAAADPRRPPHAAFAPTFADAAGLLRVGRHAEAYGRFVALADDGDVDAARFALLMHRYGPAVFGSAWDASPEQVADWTRSSARAADEELANLGVLATRRPLSPKTTSNAFGCSDDFKSSARSYGLPEAACCENDSAMKSTNARTRAAS